MTRLECRQLAIGVGLDNFAESVGDAFGRDRGRARLLGLVEDRLEARLAPPLRSRDSQRSPAAEHVSGCRRVRRLGEYAANTTSGALRRRRLPRPAMRVFVDRTRQIGVRTDTDRNERRPLCAIVLVGRVHAAPNGWHRSAPAPSLKRRAGAQKLQAPHLVPTSFAAARMFKSVSEFLVRLWWFQRHRVVLRPHMLHGAFFGIGTDKADVAAGAANKLAVALALVDRQIRAAALPWWRLKRLI